MKPAMRTICVLSLLVVAAGGSLSADPAALGETGQQDEQTAEATLIEAASESLASEYCRRAIEAAQLEPATTATIQLSNQLFRLSDMLDPDQAEILRGHLAVAILAEDSATRSELLERLAALDPSDERIRLARINDVLSRYGNADELIAAYLVILKDENIRKLGPAVASRLATALAVLYERLGDSDSYAAWISRASALDQSNKEAAALMAGYFQQHVVGDPFGQAELLVNLLLADPMDISTQAALARHLLENGAYAGAMRMYRLAVETLGAIRQPPSSDLLADLALAQWGAGDTDAAMATITRFQQLLDEVVQMRAWQENPDLGPQERAALTSPLPATLAVVHLALLDISDSQAASDALARIQQLIADAVAAEPELTADERQTALLTQAWLASWFGSDAAVIQSYLDQASKELPVGESTTARFEAWIALRSGELDRAEAVLANPVGSDDPSRQAALALLRLEQGRTPEAFEVFTALAASDPGSALGLWARERAARIAGAPPEGSALVEQLNDLVATLPRGIDQILTDRQFGMSLRVEPLEQRYRPFGPMPVRLVIANHTAIPMGISPEGPLRPNAIIESNLSAPGQPGLSKGPPIVVDVGTRLRLAPREKFEVVIDLSRYAVADYFEVCGTGGTSIELRGVLNPIPINQGVIEAGPLGHVTRSPEFRIDGVRVTAEWAATIARALRADETHDLSELGLLMHAIATGGETNGRPAAPEIAAALTDAGAALAERFESFDPIVQAWTLSLIPRGNEPLKAIVDKGRALTAPQVQLAFLINHLDGLNDPYLQAALQSADEHVARLAGHFQKLLEQQAAVENLGRQQAQPPAPPQPGGGGR